MSRSVPPLNPLHVFVTAAKVGNFTAAAEALGVTPSAVSRQIAVLEAFLDARLFHRGVHSNVLTDPGKAYFNEVAGGPVNGGWHLADSNIDWGQDLHALRDYLKENKISDIGLAYYGTVLPSSIGINAHDPPFLIPKPGWYAISVSFVNGRPHVFGNHEGASVRVGVGELIYFRMFTPVTSIGYSINVYHLTYRDIENNIKLQNEQGPP